MPTTGLHAPQPTSAEHAQRPRDVAEQRCELYRQIGEATLSHTDKMKLLQFVLQNDVEGGLAISRRWNIRPDAILGLCSSTEVVMAQPEFAGALNNALRRYEDRILAENTKNFPEVFRRLRSTPPQGSRLRAIPEGPKPWMDRLRALYAELIRGRTLQASPHDSTIMSSTDHWVTRATVDLYRIRHPHYYTDPVRASIHGDRELHPRVKDVLQADLISAEDLSTILRSRGIAEESSEIEALKEKARYRGGLSGFSKGEALKEIEAELRALLENRLGNAFHLKRRGSGAIEVVIENGQERENSLVLSHERSTVVFNQGPWLEDIPIAFHHQNDRVWVAVRDRAMGPYEDVSFDRVCTLHGEPVFIACRDSHQFLVVGGHEQRHYDSIDKSSLSIVQGAIAYRARRGDELVIVHGDREVAILSPYVDSVLAPNRIVEAQGELAFACCDERGVYVVHGKNRLGPYRFVSNLQSIDDQLVYTFTQLHPEDSRRRFFVHAGQDFGPYDAGGGSHDYHGRPIWFVERRHGEQITLQTFVDGKMGEEIVPLISRVSDISARYINGHTACYMYNDEGCYLQYRGSLTGPMSWCSRPHDVLGRCAFVKRDEEPCGYTLQIGDELSYKLYSTHAPAIRVVENTVYITTSQVEGNFLHTLVLEQLRGEVLTERERALVYRYNALVNEDPSELAQLLRILEEEQQDRANTRIATTMIDVFNRMLSRTPELFLAGVPATTERSPTLLAERMVQQLFPEIAAPTLPKGRVAKSSSPDYFTPQATTTLLGADPRELQPSMSFVERLAGFFRRSSDQPQEVMRLRGTVDFLITGAYDKVIHGRWQETLVEARPDDGPGREVTIETAAVLGHTAQLPMPVGGRVIHSRTKAIDSQGREHHLPSTINHYGAACVEVPEDARRIVYSVSVPDRGAPADVSEQSYDAFCRTLIASHGRDIVEPLGPLNELDRQVVMWAKSLPPLQRVTQLERHVRTTGFYDYDNGQVVERKERLPFEDRLRFAELRAQELRDQGQTISSQVLCAGVCNDFALRLTNILRHAGIPAGVMTGFRPTGKVVSVRDAHAVSFTYWPTESGGASFVTLDGTPPSAPSSAHTPPSLESLEERMAESEKRLVEAVQEADKRLHTVEQLIRSHNLDAIAQLTNGELEGAVNTLLRFGVRHSNVSVIEGVLDAARFGGPGAAQILDGDPSEHAAALEHLLLVGAESARRFAERYGSIEPRPTVAPGTRLLHLVSDYADRFAKDPSIGTTERAYQLMSELIRASERNLDPLEARAAMAVVTYLQARQVTSSRLSTLRDRVSDTKRAR